eukprot:gnl/TRDRNA2_/TRDRNA2_159529_c1_seq1.p1 gnl/TRDRNA2_/TRDRNA2_159529_c1~~gnl/TRDRNA2_/TRDRNA2_159529_c1_seq1.p1  ORF type:complete len:504 (-),score=49.85 gnl/TRDRNA2_/TRDRNA2_159529_c1_seq1:50-1561(-)
MGLSGKQYSYRQGVTCAKGGSNTASTEISSTDDMGRLKEECDLADSDLADSVIADIARPTLLLSSSPPTVGHMTLFNSRLSTAIPRSLKAKTSSCDSLCSMGSMGSVPDEIDDFSLSGFDGATAVSFPTRVAMPGAEAFSDENATNGPQEKRAPIQTPCSTARSCSADSYFPAVHGKGEETPSQSPRLLDKEGTQQTLDGCMNSSGQPLDKQVFATRSILKSSRTYPPRRQRQSCGPQMQACGYRQSMSSPERMLNGGDANYLASSCSRGEEHSMREGSRRVVVISPEWRVHGDPHEPDTCCGGVVRWDWIGEYVQVTLSDAQQLKMHPTEVEKLNHRIGVIIAYSQEQNSYMVRFGIDDVHGKPNLPSASLAQQGSASSTAGGKGVAFTRRLSDQRYMYATFPISELHLARGDHPAHGNLEPLEEKHFDRELARLERVIGRQQLRQRAEAIDQMQIALEARDAAARAEHEARSAMLRANAFRGMWEQDITDDDSSSDEEEWV